MRVIRKVDFTEIEFDENEEEDEESLEYIAAIEDESIGWIAFIAEYVNPDWVVHEFAGTGASLREWIESRDVEEVTGLGYSRWHDGHWLADAIGSEPTICGMMVLVKAHVDYSKIDGPEGTEYDMDWDIDTFAITYPAGVREQHAAYACETYLAAGGLCQKCRTKLRGQTLYAVKNKMCDGCAKRELETAIEVARDPLYLLKREAKSYAGRAFPGYTFDRERKREHAQIDNASDENALHTLIRGYREEIARMDMIDRMYR